MFRKTAVFLSFLLLCTVSLGAIAAGNTEQIKENVQYRVLNHPASKESKVTELFSFYCGVCAYYNQIKVIPYLDEHLSDGVKVDTYHVSIIGSLSNTLTEAWAIANVMGIQTKVVTPLFQGVQSGKIRSEKDIIKLFESNGVTAAQYKSMKTNFLVEMLVKKQHEAEKAFKITSVPSIVVNNHYLILPTGLDSSNNEVFKKDLTKVVNYLLNKDSQAKITQK